MKGFKIYNCSNIKFTSTTVLGEYDNRKITVSQMLTIAEYYTKFIRDNFDVNKRQYSLALTALKILKLRLNNQNPGKPTSEQLKSVVDVFREIADLHSQSEITKQENERIATELKMIIDFLDKLQKEKAKWQT